MDRRQLVLIIPPAIRLNFEVWLHTDISIFKILETHKLLWSCYGVLECVKYFYLSLAGNGQKVQPQCYFCFGNNEECSLAAMHADIEKYSLKCSRDYTTCLTGVREQDGRKLIEKRCSTAEMCATEKQRCDESVRSRGGRRKKKLCETYCCVGYMCNLGATFSPLFSVIALGFMLFVVLTWLWQFSWTRNVNVDVRVNFKNPYSFPSAQVFHMDLVSQIIWWSLGRSPRKEVETLANGSYFQSSPKAPALVDLR